MGLDYEKAKKAQAIAEDMAERLGLPAELLLPLAYAQLRREKYVQEAAEQAEKVKDGE